MLRFADIKALAPLLLLAAGGCAVSDEGATGEPPADAPQRPLQQVYDYRLVETSDGVRQWLLVSDEMRKYSGRREVELVTVHMDFFRDGGHFSVLTADSGLADVDSRDIHVWSNVVVVTDDGRRLETEELFYDNETELIHNEVFNRFTRDGDVLTGIGLEATPDLEYIEIKQKVEAEVTDTAAQEQDQ